MTAQALEGREDFVAADGTHLFGRWWAPDGPRKAVILIVHGYAEHSGRYDHVARFVTDRGYAAEAFDLRGHGRSSGRRALVRSVDEYIADLGTFRARVRKRNPEVPLFLLGHSMGGTIVTLAAIRGVDGVAGIVLSGPGLRAKDPLPGVVQGLVRLIGRLLPRLPMRALDAGDVSRDPDVVARYDSDPLVYRRGMPAGTLAALLDAGREIARHMEDIRLPLLLLHGSDDALTDPAGSLELHERAASEDKALRLYEGLYHEIFNEPERDEVLADLVSWLDGRSPGAEVSATGT